MNVLVTNQSDLHLKRVVKPSQMTKADSSNFDQRIAQVVMDPNNRFIPRHADAGVVRDGYVVLHNGLKVEQNVYGEFGKVFVENKGVHEPQEERVFAGVLKHIPPGGTMIELGSYWAFYSMWFNAQVPNAINFMVEQDLNNLAVGQRHFALNGMKGDFTYGYVGGDGIHIDDFVRERGITTVDILHADIQGAELEMLDGARECLLKKLISYLFISTHSQALHYDCINFLWKCGYKVIASADFDYGTYCFDGVLVCRGPSLPPPPINIELADWEPRL